MRGLWPIGGGAEPGRDELAVQPSTFFAEAQRLRAVNLLELCRD